MAACGAELLGRGPVTEEALTAAAETLHGLAEHVPDSQLERVVDLVAWPLLAVHWKAQHALVVVVERLLADDFSGSDEFRVEMLARTLALRAAAQAPLPCRRAVRLLRGLDAHPVEGFAEFHGGAQVLLPPELAAYVDDLAPELPQEEARAKIVELCARDAARRPSVARAVLQSGPPRPSPRSCAAGGSWTTRFSSQTSSPWGSACRMSRTLASRRT